MLNASWLLVTQVGWLWASVGVIATLALVLGLLARRLTAIPAGGGAGPPWVERLVVDGTFGLYLGWVSVATVANIGVQDPTAAATHPVAEPVPQPGVGRRAGLAVRAGCACHGEPQPRECDNAVCRQVSFTYGAGRPALWSHSNLGPEVHEWIRGEFGKVPMSFFAQMDACVKAGPLVSVSRRDGLPEDYGVTAPRTDARWVLYAGRNNRCFLPESQERTHRWLEGLEPGRHALHVVPGYGHLDIFLGRNAARDVFPGMLEELAR